MYKQDVLSIEEICRKLKPIFGEKIDKIYFSYISSESREAKEEISTMLHALYEKHFSNLLDSTTLLTPPQSQSDVSGKYPIGNVVYGKRSLFPFSLREQDLPRHICISGMSGSGKTTLAFNILEGFIAENKPFLVFDWKKSFRPLLARDSSLTCFTIGDNKLANDFKLNINRPPQGVSPKEWITVMCDLIAESFFVSYGVHKILLETLDESYKEWGVYKGSDNYPTWNHIKWKLEQRLETAKNREGGWIESALRVATVLTFGDFGEVVNYKGESQVRVEDLSHNRVVFELNALGNIEKKFFSEFILMYIYKMRKVEQNKVTNKFNYAILVDEAHNIFLKDKTKFVQESVTDMIYREMREYGVSLICLDQHISKLSDTVKGNSACHIAFQQQLPADIESVSRLMHLSDYKELFSNLEVGSGVVKLSERYTKPFFIKAPYNESRSLHVSNNEIKQRVSRFLSKEEFKRNRDPDFIRTVTKAGGFDINDLFKNITLPKRLALHATKDDDSDFVFDPTPEPTPMSETLYATIKRRLSQGESLELIATHLRAMYESSEVDKALEKINEENKEAEEVEVMPRIQMPSRVSAKNRSATITEKLNKFKNVNFSSSEPVISGNNEQKTDTNVFKEPLFSSNTNLTEEESKFVAFLTENHSHELTTVNLYKEIGFSPRKGNKIKNQLLEKELLDIIELKNDKGWKKIIRLKASQ